MRHALGRLKKKKTRMKGHDLSQGSVLKTLVLFAIPFLIANILQSLYGAVDLFVVGRFCSADAQAAVSVGTQVTQIVTSLITGLTLGSTVLIGKYTGMKKMDDVKKLIGTSFVLFAIVAIVIMIAILLILNPLLNALNTPEESFEYAKRYVSICMYGNIFVCGYNAISSVLRGYGDSTRPMIFVAIACIINIGLDFLFVGAMSMGVEGTALATIVAQGVSMIVAVVYLKKKDFIFDFKLASFRPYSRYVKEIATVGIPISFQELMVRISFLYLMTVMNRCGVYAAAVYGVGSKYDVFAMLTATSMANALAAITAQNYGANKPERARKSLWQSLGIALVVSFCFWIWAQVSPESMIGVFSGDADVIAAGIPFFKACSYDYFLVSIVFVLNGYLNGRQKTVWTMISCCIGALALRIPLVHLFGTLYSDDLGKLGTIAPTVSAVMACYTLIYVVIDAKREGRRKTI